jgi:hypothetical protein
MRPDVVNLIQILEAIQIAVMHLPAHMVTWDAGFQTRSGRSLSGLAERGDTRLGLLAPFYTAATWTGTPFTAALPDGSSTKVPGMSTLVLGPGRLLATEERVPGRSCPKP